MHQFLRTGREVLRHWMLKAGVTSPRLNQQGTLAERFSGIYERGEWEATEDAPSSGTGSSLAATEDLRRELPKLLERLGTETLLDIGCGDFTWMRHVELPCQYHGIDVVHSIVASNKAQFSDARRTFEVLNAVDDRLPPADTVLCREVIFHLSFADARKLLTGIAAIRPNWVMLTTDTRTRFNADIMTGGARLLNLEIAPFHLGKPDHVIEEPGSYAGRRIGVWQAARLASALA